MPEFYTILLEEDFTNNKIVCTPGLNELTTEFISRSSKHTGFFISKRTDLAYRLCDTYNDHLKYFSHVVIPDDAKQTVAMKGLHVDKVILTKLEPIENFDWNINDCKINGMALKFIKEQTVEICMEAVKNNRLKF